MSKFLPKIEDYLILISDDTRHTFLGTGFFVQTTAGIYVVTTTHVVADSLGIQRQSLDKSSKGQLKVFFPKSNSWLTATITQWVSRYEDDDVAILKPNRVPQHCVPARLTSSEGTTGHQFISAGYRQAGSMAQGIVLGHELLSRKEGRHRRLELSSHNIDKGMSGSPIVDVRSGLVIGMIVSVWYSETGKDENTAYGVTSETIAHICGQENLVVSSLDVRLESLAKSIIYSYENPPKGDLVWGINTDLYIDMPLWEYGVKYVNENTVQFSWLSEEQKEIERRRGLITESAIEYLLEWSYSLTRQNLLVLGEFGMGKSTLLRRFEYELAKQYLQSTDSPFPIFLPLGYGGGTPQKHNQLISNIRDYIHEKYGQDFTLKEIGGILNGKTILILDGFDEMSKTPIPGTQILGFNKIAHAISEIEKPKILISSRDNYFYGSGNIKDALGEKDAFFLGLEFEIVYLRGFRPKEIMLYLDAHLGKKSKGFWGELQKIHDLPDLARRPILLLMMTILEKEILTGKVHTRQSLYQEFVRVWLKRERLSERIQLADDTIVSVLTMLAEKASLERGRTFPQDEIDELLESEFGFTRSEARNYGADFKVCCFLGRSPSDHYQFLHDSFREFFFALSLKKHLDENVLDVLRETFISTEVGHFLVESFSNEDDLVPFLQNIIRTESGSDYLLSNAMMLYEMLVQHQNEIEHFYATLPSNQREAPSSKQKNLPKHFVVIPAGSFLMGAWYGRPDEVPVHQVHVAEFALCKYPVTNAEFLEFVQATGYVTEAEKHGESKVWTGGKWKVIKGLSWKNPRPDNLGISQRLDHPVVQISWHDAIAYCNWLSEVWGMMVELPSEAEWEYACRAGSLGKWCFGNDESLLGEYGWYKENLNRDTSTQPVGLKKPNAFGLYDMHGNVREWCKDIYERYPGNNLDWDLGYRYFSESGEEYHVLRGGHFGSTARFLCSAIRVSGRRGLSTDYTGFRLKINL